MRTARSIVAVVTATGLSVLGVAPALAATSPPTGVGTASGSDAVFSLALGTSDPSATTAPLLGVGLLGDIGSANTDPAVSAPSALVRLGGLKTVSPTVSALNLSVPSPPYQAQAPGGPPSLSTSAVDLSNVAGVSVPASVATGTIVPATLSASASSSQAAAGLSAGLSNLTLAGGLVSLSSASSTLANGASSTGATSTRSLQLGPLTVNLSQVLAGLGINLSALPVATLSNLLSSLGLTVQIPSILPSTDTLATAAGTLGTALTTINSALSTGTVPLLSSRLDVGGVTVPGTGSIPTPTGITTTISSGVVDTTTGALTTTFQTDLQNALTGLGLNLTVPTTLAGLEQLFSTLQSDLSGLLTSALQALSTAPLLKATGATVQVTADAASTVSASKAAIAATLGSVQVGGLSTPSINLASPATQISSVVSSLNSTLSGVLSQVSPDLANLVTVSVLAPAAGNGVTSAGKYVKASEGVTVLSAAIKPPADLSTLVSGINGAASSASTVSALLQQAGVSTSSITSLVSSLTPISTLSATLQTVGALTQGAVLKLGAVQASSQYQVLALTVTRTPAGATSAPAPSAGLPRTGTGPTGALLGVLVAVAALAGRRMLGGARRRS